MSLTTANPAEVTGMDCGPPPRTGSTARSARSARSARGYASGKDDYLARLRKIVGQVCGLQMVEAVSWCPDVVSRSPRPPGPCRRSQRACSPTTCAIGS